MKELLFTYPVEFCLVVALIYLIMFSAVYVSVSAKTREMFVHEFGGSEMGYYHEIVSQHMKVWSVVIMAFMAIVLVLLFRTF